jgi:hypothetical protein
MPTPPTNRDLARRLLAYEAAAAKTSEASESTALRAYEKLRKGLGEFTGVAGFHSLASRALALARTDTPSLSEVRVSADGELLGLGRGLCENERQIDIDKDRGSDLGGDEGGTILIACLLGLLFLFLGEPLTMSLLRVTWPNTMFDECSSENGSKT